jgi:uncharacterized protein YdhG (YjbR/CyaY superfamily)
MKKYSSVDEYVADFPPNIREILNNLRRVIKESALQAEESISYGMPGYKLNGKALIYFAAWKKHIGLYGASSAVDAFKQELSPYKVLKGTIQLPLDKPIPLNLIGELVKFKRSESLNGYSDSVNPEEDQKPGKRIPSQKPF